MPAPERDSEVGSLPPRHDAAPLPATPPRPPGLSILCVLAFIACPGLIGVGNSLSSMSDRYPSPLNTLILLWSVHAVAAGLLGLPTFYGLWKGYYAAWCILQVLLIGSWLIYLVPLAYCSQSEAYAPALRALLLQLLLGAGGIFALMWFLYYPPVKAYCSRGWMSGQFRGHHT